MKLTKKQQEYIKDAYNRACVDWKQEIKDNFPELFENKLEVGKWYKRGHRYLICYKGNGRGYGFFDGSYGGAWAFSEYTKTKTKNIEATKEEVEEALIKEAKKRGFKKGVTIDKSNLDYPFKKIWIISSNHYFFDITDNTLMIGSDYIFNNGKWAEIIPEAKEMTVEEISKELGYEVKVVK